MSTLTDLLAASSLAVSAGVLLSYGRDAIAQFVSARAEAKKLAQELETAALQSNSISELGGYLYDNIGATRVSNYVDDNAVRERVTRALDSVVAFLGPEEVRITAEEVEEAEAATPAPSVPQEQGEVEQLADAEMRRALQEIQYGETWNGLARMRRHIEVQLRRIAPPDSFPPNVSAGRLLELMARRGVIQQGTVKQLRFAIRVANAGVHGEDVNPGQAEEAWNMARVALAELDPAGRHDAD